MFKPPSKQSPTPSVPPAIPVIGLTGGIGSGKSTVAGLLRDRGVPVIDADQLARRVVEPGRDALDQIAEYFGARMLQPDGGLNRAMLARAVFSDEIALGALNEITHPAILSEAMGEIETLKSEGYQWAIYEAALIVDAELCPPLQGLIAVTASQAIRLSRVMDRDALSARDVLARMASQVRPERVAAHADWIVENDGPTTQLERVVDELIRELGSKFGPAHSQQKMGAS